MLIFSLARPNEADEIMKVVLDAYAVEVGTGGVAFNTSNRYLNVEQVLDHIMPGSVKQAYLVARLVADGPIVGCVHAEFLNEDQHIVCDVGPLAVATSH